MSLAQAALHMLPMSDEEASDDELRARTALEPEWLTEAATRLATASTNDEEAADEQPVAESDRATEVQHDGDDDLVPTAVGTMDVEEQDTVRASLERIRTVLTRTSDMLLHQPRAPLQTADTPTAHAQDNTLYTQDPPTASASESPPHVVTVSDVASLVRTLDDAAQGIAGLRDALTALSTTDAPARRPPAGSARAAASSRHGIASDARRRGARPTPPPRPTHPTPIEIEKRLVHDSLMR